MMFKRKVPFFFLAGLILLVRSVAAEDSRCPGADDPPPPVLKVDLPKLTSLLEQLKDSQGRIFWKTTEETKEELRETFESTPSKTKLEQFFQLLYLIQRNIGEEALPMVVNPPGITEVLLTAKVFTDAAFPQKITAVELKYDDPNRPPLYRVQFSESEVRFPINRGRGFATWDQGMCQIAKELIFYPGFSFRLRKARNSRNLVVDDFQGVEIYGQFGTRKIFSIDLNYIDLEKVEFIRGTDQGKVKARVARREFKENKHSKLFKFIGSLIPNTSRQRIDW
jgi:hypothetical protein